MKEVKLPLTRLVGTRKKSDLILRICNYFLNSNMTLKLDKRNLNQFNVYREGKLIKGPIVKFEKGLYVLYDLYIVTVEYLKLYDTPPSIEELKKAKQTIFGSYKIK